MKPSCLSKKTKGFTLLELLLSLSISLIIISVIGVILGFSLKVLKNDFLYSKNHSSIEYATSYIEKEVGRSLKIYQSSKFPYNLKKDNLGFVIEILPYEDFSTYDYVYYYMKDDKLYRELLSTRKPLEDGQKPVYKGTNAICENLISVSKSYFDKDKNYINLNFSYREKGKTKTLNSGIYVEVTNED
ncbi:MAG: prepilin-type N-terminal cleavage/methylation domain-containing protein [Lagierella massiliensis]|nr:prepilin-type N-terminal cleavage/methylation domain-containing protein [Lagierella massiliensis]